MRLPLSEFPDAKLKCHRCWNNVFKSRIERHERKCHGYNGAHAGVWDEEEEMWITERSVDDYRECFPYIDKER